MVYWITGLAGAGKTAIGEQLFHELKMQKDSVVFLDGDILRSIFGDDLGYSREDRLKCARRYSNICRMLSEQGLDVVICTISMFHSVRDWNKKNIKDYKEVYIKVSEGELQRRDKKGLYSGAAQGMVEDVVGVDIISELPQNPDVVIENDMTKPPNELARQILERVRVD